jgi:predicted RNA-binding Zn ribbon-like protein
MISIEVAGQHLPAPLAGDPALEFCNTWAGWNDPPGAGGDYLESYDVLAVWAHHHGLLSDEDAATVDDARERGSAAERKLVQEARELRGALFQLLTGDATARDHRIFASYADEARASQRWCASEDGTFSWRLRPRNVLRLPLLAVADAAATLLAEPGRASAVHACPGRGCGWLFLDPKGRRRWCSMAVCGNRAKARKHAARRDSGR